MNIKLIRLTTREELLAEVLESSDANFICVKNPVRVIVMPNKIDPKAPSVGFTPWIEFTDDKEFSIDKSHVVAIVTPIPEFVNQYSSMFSGLVLPKSNLIIPGQ